MSHVFRLDDIERYESWFRSDVGRSAFALQKDLLLKVWGPVSPQRVLEVGCGSGVFLEWFNSLGHMVTGIDPSTTSLELARRRMGGRAGLNRGFAEDLPYSDNEFDTVSLITSLEFVEDPSKALQEAFRVARRTVLLGVLNRYSIGRVHDFIERFWKESLYSHAHSFSIFQLKKMSARILHGQVPIKWRTGFTLPPPLMKYMHYMERCPVCHCLPFGHFIAMRIDVPSRLRTIQTPVFSEIPAGAEPSFRGLCLRFPPAAKKSRMSSETPSALPKSPV